LYQETCVKTAIRQARILASAAVLTSAIAIPASAQFSAANPIRSWQQPSGSYLAATYQYDDGTSENSLGLTAGGDMGWLHVFDTIPASNKIGQIEFTIGTPTASNGPLLGATAKACVWKDPNNDGNPTDAMLIAGPVNHVVTSVDAGVFMTVTTPPTTISGKFFIGIVITHIAGNFPASMDQSQASMGRAWVVGTNTPGAFNFANLGGNSIPPVEMDSINFPSVFLLRGEVGGTTTVPFCTAKAGLVCGTPAISATGTSSVAANSGFVVSAGPARDNRSGILMYNNAGTVAGLPFNGGTLCVNPMGIRRAGSANSGGSCPPAPIGCSGSFYVDMNSFAQGVWVVPDCAGNPSGIPPNMPAAFLLVAGTTIDCQFWGRDSVATGSFVSDGLTYVTAP
jgi:hypothetical protein